jgi:hypothetical protein
MVRQALRLLPEHAVYHFTSASAQTFFYDDEGAFKHKVIYVGEGVAFYADTRNVDEGTSVLAGIIRQLQSDHVVTRKVVQKTDDPDRPMQTITIIRYGPISLVLTSTRTLNQENETRNLRLRTDETPEQTDRILRARGQHRGDPRLQETVDLQPWHDLYAYLTLGLMLCRVPFAARIAEHMHAASIRARRDYDAVISAIEAHALLNQQRRQRDADGYLLAERADYEAIQPLFAPLLDYSERGKPDQSVCRVYDFIAAEANKVTTTKGKPQPLRKPKGLPAGIVTIRTRDLGKALGVHHATAARYLNEACNLGLLENLETRQNRPARLKVIAKPPTDTEDAILPAPNVVFTP